MVVDLLYGTMGVLHSVQAGSETCNGRLAKVAREDPYVNVKDCIHIDDINAAFPSKPQGVQSPS